MFIFENAFSYLRSRNARSIVWQKKNKTDRYTDANNGVSVIERISFLEYRLFLIVKGWRLRVTSPGPSRTNELRYNIEESASRLNSRAVQKRPRSIWRPRSKRPSFQRRLLIRKRAYHRPLKEPSQRGCEVAFVRAYARTHARLSRRDTTFCGDSYTCRPAIHTWRCVYRRQMRGIREVKKIIRERARNGTSSCQMPEFALLPRSIESTRSFHDLLERYSANASTLWASSVYRCIIS